MNPLKQLNEFGQSVWLDFIRRDLITNGELERLVREDGLRGLTSNPAIFEKAIIASNDYADVLPGLKQKGLAPMEIYEVLAVRDIQDAADLLRPVYDHSGAEDGYVSLEVSPHLARDTEATLKEARRLWFAVHRPNLMVKVPGTAEGLPAIRQLIGEGINVNITLIFDPEVYEQVALAYLSGIETAAAAGRDVKKIASVASFFISRIDSAVDAQLDARIKATSDLSEQGRIRGLRGKSAIATAKLAYRRFKQLSAGERWRRLATLGAHPQRLLWASTSTKDPSYRDVLYVEELIGPETVDTMPPATLAAFRDHGVVRASLEEDLDAAQEVWNQLESLGISIKSVTERLVVDGLRLFEEPFDKLLHTLAQRESQRPAVAA